MLSTEPHPSPYRDTSLSSLYSDHHRFIIFALTRRNRSAKRARRGDGAAVGFHLPCRRDKHPSYTTSLPTPYTRVLALPLFQRPPRHSAPSATKRAAAGHDSWPIFELPAFSRRASPFVHLKCTPRPVHSSSDGSLFRSLLLVLLYSRMASPLGGFSRPCRGHPTEGRSVVGKRKRKCI